MNFWVTQYWRHLVRPQSLSTTQRKRLPVPSKCKHYGEVNAQNRADELPEVEMAIALNRRGGSGKYWLRAPLKFGFVGHQVNNIADRG